ncbi:hypothetical protein LRR81_07965 [Metabacillus sp. GX 13764]|uniref:hypothetical protein n=1 Tax=Metabacillus kandeliae TaxID=2900151 RepID=UPI001E29541E|nr:hypothetical protein [Metabacillus kandeliae]MCD7034166.1 hypothetical protein [Metabacillus kandeliae]
MKKSLLFTILGSAAAAAGTAWAVMATKKKQQPQFLEDTDMRNSVKLDQEESQDATVDPEEQGLSKLDSAQRAEWVANGIPQTHQEMKELEEEEKEEQHR